MSRLPGRVQLASSRGTALTRTPASAFVWTSVAAIGSHRLPAESSTRVWPSEWGWPFGLTTTSICPSSRRSDG
jgi:hypothetical protein